MATTSTISTTPASTTLPSFHCRRPHQNNKNKMSLAQTYYLAHTARSKLSREAARADHDLRLLVGHANMLDSLMLELANAEKEQERWFNQTVRNARYERPRHIQWADTVPEEEEDEEDSASDLSSDDSDYDDYEEEDEDTAVLTATTVSKRRAPAPVPVLISEQEVDDDSDDDSDEYYEEDEVEEDEDAGLEDLSLTRTPSRQSPPELLDDLSSDEEDDPLPPSPVAVSLDTFEAVSPEKPRDTTEYDQENGYYTSSQGTMIQAY